MSALAGRKVLVGVSGGIAAYKAAELVRLLVKGGAQVRVTMTEGAQKFITPLTMQALSQHPVATDTFDLTQESTIGHIALADWADLMVVAPASADVIAKLSHGLAGDVLTTIALACRAPLLIAPAMNVNMWNHPATQSNLRVLVERGAHTVGPDAGDLACGWVGQGRMAEADEISEACARILSYAAPSTDLAGVPVLVTAGPTWEPIDPVRYVGNRSTGKMGFAVAEAASARGASVTLVAGPTALTTPRGITRVDVETAQQMHDAVIARADVMRVVVMVAAVADYRPNSMADSKLKKESLGASPSLPLTQNPDILAELGHRSYAGPAPVLVGFAAETDDVEKRAVAKRRSKGCALLVANDVTESGSGFGTDTNRVLLVGPDDQVEHLPQMGKREVAHRILDRVKNLL
jgi:phosphopantothenoylcysteine decarboxylase / phosphopantothenate---cysteine ligase